MYRLILRLVAFVALSYFQAPLVNAQTAKPVTIGFLSPALAAVPPIFSQAFRERGYEEGRNLRIESAPPRAKPKPFRNLQQNW